MKSTNRTKKFSERTQLNFKATFTGGVFATPIIFNPNAADIRRIKNIPEEYKVTEPDYSRVIQDKEYRTVKNNTFFFAQKELTFFFFLYLCK